MNNPYLNAVFASAYIVGVAFFMYYGSKVSSPKESVFIPMAMLSLLTLSVAVMGFLFFYRPIRIYLEGDKEGAVKFFAKTVLGFFLLTVSFFGVVFFSSGGQKIYESDEFRISFSYSKNYFLEEKDLSDGHRYRYAIVLTENTEENRAVREGRAPGREGPTSITVEIFQNNLDNYNAENWVKGTSYSNWKLSPDGKIEELPVAGEKALHYRWSGLYEGETVALARPDFIYAFSVTYFSPEDQIRKDFFRIIDSASFGR